MTAPAVESGRFKCPACNKRFILLGDKKRHVKAAHPWVPKT